jgi:hypothetical protein
MQCFLELSEFQCARFDTHFGTMDIWCNGNSRTRFKKAHQGVKEGKSMHEQYGRLNRAAVDKLLQTREAIMRAHPGQVFEDSSELIHQAHEEQSRELEQR